jgi:3',5'-cyclic AMP phosphodiesterase CpdA
LRILHFSDPHVQLPRWRERPLRDFGPLRALATVELWKGRGRDYEGALATLRQIVRDADNLRADFAVCTGDLTQLAMEEEFALAQDALAPLGDRLVCIPGNHDRYSLSSRTACTRRTSPFVRCPTDSSRSTRAARCAGR